ncbi:MAG TPA: thiamine-phosphate kinase [Gaiellaceae bacterium]|jgi:thiamine-monophosphate kinase|nr:thiamine-phosphate kinase [Gaiellaceae bacterium]
MQLLELGELGLLAELERRGLVAGVEHDAALISGTPPGETLVATQDALVENVHFQLDWIDWRALGFRAAAVNLSDLAASGATPQALLVTLAVPGTTLTADVIAFYEGIAEAGVPVVGGDTTSSGSVVISVTALGHSARVPGRAGALPGDLLVVTGPLGAAGAAFRAQRYEPPPVRLEEGRALAETAHALMDISDGIAVDVGHIARRSGVRCVIDLDAVPLAPGATIEDVGFGEDFELLAAVGEAQGLAAIGRVEAGEGVVTLRGGEPYALLGWEHFASAES